MSLKITKTFNRSGRWVERPTRSEILMCSCGSKYIKTRTQQKMCLKCLGRLMVR